MLPAHSYQTIIKRNAFLEGAGVSGAGYSDHTLEQVLDEFAAKKGFKDRTGFAKTLTSITPLSLAESKERLEKPERLTPNQLRNLGRNYSNAYSKREQPAVAERPSDLPPELVSELEAMRTKPLHTAQSALKGRSRSSTGGLSGAVKGSW